jgi:hypothetical protein
MPKYLLLYLILFFSFGRIGDDGPKGVKTVNKPKETPPGTIRLNDSLYIDVNPVTNISYREFTSFLSVSYSKVVRDSLQNIPLYGLIYEQFQIFMRRSGKDVDLDNRMQIKLSQKLSWAMSMEEYINSPTYNQNPIINVSFSQANEFCKWRTDVVHLRYSIDSKNEKQRQKYYTKIRYRLPTAEEWDLAIDAFPDNIITNKEIFPYNKACTFPVVPQGRRPQFMYVPGNVAEMTSTEHLAVGISWIDNDTIIDPKKRVQYFGARDWLSFRCICEIIEY